MSQQLDNLRQALDSGRQTSVKQVLNALHPGEIGLIIESLPTGEREIVWNLVDDEDRGEVLLHLNDELRAWLMKAMDSDEAITAAEGLEVDDLADFIEDLPEKLTQAVLNSMDQAQRMRVEAVMSYPHDTAGGLMNTDTVSIRPNVTAEVVLRYLRMRGDIPTHTDVFFVVDRYGHFLGAVPVRKILTAQPETPISEFIIRDFKSFPVVTPENEVAKSFEDLDLISAPVVDDRNILLGRITIDDIVDVIRDEGEHTLMSAVGLDEEDDIFAPVRRSAKRRAVWLGVNLLTAFMAAGVVGLFEATLDQIVALAVLMPVVASMGGIGGSQTLTLMIRGLALGQISTANAVDLLKKEVSVAIINGFLWACVVGCVVMLWFQSPMLALVIGMALVINQLCAALAGVGLPLLLKQLNIDPALAGSVVLTTITDVIGFFAFLGLGATLLL